MTTALPRRPRMAALAGPARMLLHPDVTTTAAELRGAIHDRHAHRLDVVTDDATTREVSTAQAAAMLGCHRSTILRRIRAGTLIAEPLVRAVRRLGWFWRITVDVAHGLTEIQRRVLDFAAHRLPAVRQDGTHINVIAAELGLPYTRYSQILTTVLDLPAALVYDGAAVMRLRRLREAAMARRGLDRRRLEPLR